MTASITITSYQLHHQPGISDLLDGIQGEFSQSIYAQNPPKNPLPVKLWVALYNDVVVGTVGIILLSNGNAALKSMMVQKEFRGGDHGLSGSLMNRALQYARDAGAQNIYLGTMAQFKAAQQFYRKHGFVEITARDLPADFIINPVDDVFFRLQIN